MAITRCTKCNIPMTETEVRQGVCPECATPLPVVESPPITPNEPPAPASSRGLRMTIGIAVVSVLLIGV
jgi:hypothetical protein